MPYYRSRPTHHSTRQSLPFTATQARSSTTSPAHTLLPRARSRRWCASESPRRYRLARRVKSLHLRPLRAHKNALQLHNSDKPVLSATRSGKKSLSTVICSMSHGPVSRGLSITKQPPAYPTHRPCLRTDLLTPSQHNQSLLPSWIPLGDRSMTTCLRFQLVAFSLDSRQAYRYLAHSTRPLELYSHRHDLCTRQ